MGHPGGAEAGVSLGEGFGHDLGFSQGQHEIGVAGPARHDVDVDVPGNTGAGGFADVGADVEPVRFIDAADDADGVGGQFHHLGARLCIQVFERVQVFVRYHHEMTGGVWVAVQDGKTVVSAEKDQVFQVVGLLLNVAENAAGDFGLDEFGAPGSPEAFHMI